MGAALQLPVTMLVNPFRAKFQVISRQDLLHITEYTASVGFSRPQPENLAEPGLIHLRLYPGIAEDSLDFR